MENTLRARVRAGDPDAFGELFERDARAVYNLSFRLTGSWPDAEEAVSLTFLEAWRLRGRVEVADGSLRPWLLGIAVNVTRNMNRAGRRHQAAMRRIPPPPPVPDFADELAGQLDDAARVRRVLAALERLRPGERDVLALCVWSGLDYGAAAKALGVPAGTIRSRLFRARRKLRHLVTDEPGPEPEPLDGRGQVEGGCENAAQPMQEETR
jgi:RNA polymerase sigma-70 factor, ECF subfamily